MTDMEASETYAHRFRDALLELEDLIEAHKSVIKQYEEWLTASFETLGKRLTHLSRHLGDDEFHSMCDTTDIFLKQGPLLDRWLEENVCLPNKEEQPILGECLDAEHYFVMACERVARKQKRVWSLLHVLALSGAKVIRQRLITEFFEQR